MAAGETPFRIVERRAYFDIQLFDGLPGAVSPAFESQTAGIANSDKHVIVSCAGVQAIPSAWVEAFRALDQKRVPARKQARYIYTAAPVKGALSGLKTCANLAEALDELGTGQAELGRGHFIKSFVTSAIRTVYMQAKIQCEQKKIGILPDDAPEKLMGNVSGVILVEGAAATYVVAASFPERTLLTVVSNMLGRTFDDLSNAALEGAAGLFNGISEQAKLVLNEGNAAVRPSAPWIVRGRTLSDIKPDAKHAKARQLLERGKIIVVPFTTPVGDFFIQVCFPKDFNAQQLRK